MMQNQSSPTIATSPNKFHSRIGKLQDLIY